MARGGPDEDTSGADADQSSPAIQPIFLDVFQDTTRFSWSIVVRYIIWIYPFHTVTVANKGCLKDSLQEAGW